MGPPPPALPAKLAAENPCRGCGAPCVSACEPNLIHLHPDGHAAAGVPYLDFETQGCTFCNDCVQQCPLKREANPSDFRLGLAILDRVICVAWNGVICMSCQYSCTYGAIRMNGQSRPSIDAHACTGCGFCIGVCPAKAIAISF